MNLISLTSADGVSSPLRHDLAWSHASVPLLLRSSTACHHQRFSLIKLWTERDVEMSRDVLRATGMGWII